MTTELPLIPLALTWVDLAQTLDALTTRAEAYERTADFLDSQDAGREYDYGDDFFLIEEVDDAAEAREIAAHFREVHASLEAQWSAWQANGRPGA